MSLNLSALVQTAFNAVPSSAKATVVFTNPASTASYDSGTDTMAAPQTPVTVTCRVSRVKGNPRTYERLSLIETEAPTLLVEPDASGSIPLLGATCPWVTRNYVVMDVDPIEPGGSALAAFVVISR